MKKMADLESDIGVLNLKARVEKALRDAGISTVLDLLMESERSLVKMEGIGRTAVSQISSEVFGAGHRLCSKDYILHASSSRILEASEHKRVYMTRCPACGGEPSYGGHPSSGSICVNKDGSRRKAGPHKARVELAREKAFRAVAYDYKVFARERAARKAHQKILETIESMPKDLRSFLMKREEASLEREAIRKKRIKEDKAIAEKARRIDEAFAKRIDEEWARKQDPTNNEIVRYNPDHEMTAQFWHYQEDPRLTTGEEDECK